MSQLVKGFYLILNAAIGTFFLWMSTSLWQMLSFSPKVLPYSSEEKITSKSLGVLSLITLHQIYQNWGC